MTKKEIESPSGKYTLEIESIPTKPGCWNYTRGTVRGTEGEIIAEVDRNYSSFPHLFVEGHANGHDYLVCGEDYQGQTVIELDTGLKRSFLPEEAAKGFGFCWTDYKYDPTNKLLLVAGCYWACPYEFRVYDFSDPMGNGWPHLKLLRDEEELEAECSQRYPEVKEDLITFFETREIEDYEGDDDGEGMSYRTVASSTYRIKEGVLLWVQGWIDPEEERQREENRKRQEEWNHKWNEYKKTDPLYLAVCSFPQYKEGKNELGVGWCYKGWHPTESFSDERIIRTLFTDTDLVVSIEWGRYTAPVKLVVKSNEKSDVFWFSRTEMDKALKKAQEYVERVR